MDNISAGDSKPVVSCQICASKNLSSLIFLGFVPPVNQMLAINTIPQSEIRFPLELLRCEACSLVQIGYEVDPKILFPFTYPYLSGTTRILRDNFKDLANELQSCFPFDKANSLVIDIGANDGTLLMPFHQAGFRVLGIEPSQAFEVGRKAGIPMINSYFNSSLASETAQKFGKSKVVTAANVFAHIKDVHDVVEGVKTLLDSDGIFISESHYLLDLIETLQYDTIYHEHLRYYSLRSLKNLFAQHDLEIIKVKRIPTHGGSIRVYTARKNTYKVDASVEDALLKEENFGLNDINVLNNFCKRVVQSKLDLIKLLSSLKEKGARIYGVGAPSRASTLINYVGLDNGIIDCVVEVFNSHKLNKYIPGTRVPVLDEKKLYIDQPEYIIFYSWHIAQELSENLRKRGYKGKFITPLPKPRILSEISADVELVA